MPASFRPFVPASKPPPGIALVGLLSQGADMYHPRLRHDPTVVPGQAPDGYQAKRHGRVAYRNYRDFIDLCAAPG